ncbi:hypothetical protein MtrunA17_Chr2g0317141 [Medicago truncatula]|uniref:Kinase, putative n=1 Tax=Medicago truncatula TaxID=3880 RepID=A0A072V9I3_MEDTR|nr:kinase, putative [Medicago truncatula]RHN75068.1 hypothetical protein MtrunA17_Chr2g0317141 [Medicago truncatula]
MTVEPNWCDWHLVVCSMNLENSLIQSLLVVALAPLQKETGVPSHSLMSIQHSATIAVSLSPLSGACSTKDLTAIHEVLENIGYKEYDGVANGLSFQMWTDQMQDSLESAKSRLKKNKFVSDKIMKIGL